GSGGAGKTRLALQVAGRAAAGEGAGAGGRFADGVRLAPLAPLTDPELVLRAVAAAAGVRETVGRPLRVALLESLRPRRLLLVMDNCEPVSAACAVLVAELLRACPELRVLATSREPLGVGGEVTWTVPPLALPEQTPEVPVPSLEELAANEAVRLFLDRAAAA